MTWRFATVVLGGGAVVLLLSAAVPYWNWHPDEVTYIQIALESRARGEWMDATYFGDRSFFKPPLLYWAMRGSMSLLGDTLLAARLPSLLTLFTSAWLVFHWLRRSHGLAAATVGALTMLLGPVALRFGHLAMFDVPLGLTFLGAAVVGRDARVVFTLPRRVLLALTVAGAMWLKGPAMWPLVVAAFALEARVEARRMRWVVPVVGGTALGSSWVVYSLAVHGQPFVDVFIGKENLGRLAAPWTLAHLLVLVGVVSASGLPFRPWPLGFLGSAAIPRFARWFPLVVLGFYAIPSVTFAHYVVSAAPAVALGAGALSAAVPRWLLAAYATLASTVLLGGAAVSMWLTTPAPFTCQALDVEQDKPGMYWVVLRRADGAKPRCSLTPPPCSGEAVELRIPRAQVAADDVLAALRERSSSPLTQARCLASRTQTSARSADAGRTGRAAGPADR